jgi:hypothetical protein
LIKAVSEAIRAIRIITRWQISLVVLLFGRAGGFLLLDREHI